MHWFTAQLFVLLAHMITSICCPCYLEVPFTVEGEHRNKEAHMMKRAHMKVWRTNGVIAADDFSVYDDVATDFHISYMGTLDGREATIYKDNDDLIIDDDRVRLELTAIKRHGEIWWDVIINSRWDYSCKLDEVCQDIGLLCHLFIDENKIRVAQSSTSVCKSALEVDRQSAKKPRVRFNLPTSKKITEFGD